LQRKWLQLTLAIQNKPNTYLTSGHHAVKKKAYGASSVYPMFKH